MKHVCHFRHALALDERRVKFLPEYTYGGVTENSQGVPAQNKIQKKETAPHEDTKDGSKTVPNFATHSKEVWFSGTHSDM